jgi:2'-5' RNA ligase
MRVFIGIWPPTDVLNTLVGAQDELARLTSRGVLRLTKAEQIHLTLRFLGEVREDQIEALSASLRAGVETMPDFHLRLSSLGAFPTPEQARVIWSGVDRDVEPLMKLQAIVDAAAGPFAGQPAGELFRPHLTVARTRQPRSPERRQIARAIEQIRFVRRDPWPAEAVRLVRSRLDPEGSRYETIVEIPLVTTRYPAGE